MDLSAVNINLTTLTGSNITIIIGIFVTLAVMGITTFYDKRKGEGKPLAKSSELKPSFNLSQKIKDFSSKYTSNFSEYGKKFSDLIPKRVKKQKLENNEIKPLKATNEIPKIFGTIRSKISSFSFTLRGKKNKFESGKPVPQSSKKVKASKFG